MVAAAVSLTVYASHSSHGFHAYYGLAILTLAAATSRMKIKLPGIDGNMSVNLPFLLMGVVNLSAVEAVFIACLATVVQCWPKLGSKFKPEQMLFNVSMMAVAANLAGLTWHAGEAGQRWASEAVMLAGATVVFLLGQTVPVAGILRLAEGVALRRVWLGIVHLSFPYYVLSAGMTSMVNQASHRFGWQAALVVFPVMYGIHRSYCLYFKGMVESPGTVLMARAARAGA
jgi:hypothetical protein